MSNKYTRFISEFNNLNYKNIDFKNNNHTPILIFCSFYINLLFYLQSTGIYFIIFHNCLNYSDDLEPVKNDIQLLKYFIEATQEINKKIKSKELDFFIDYLNNIYKIDINAFILNTSIDKELNKISYFENMFINKKNKIEKDIAFFIYKNYNNQEIRDIFPEFHTLEKLDKF